MNERTEARIRFVFLNEENPTVAKMVTSPELELKDPPIGRTSPENSVETLLEKPNLALFNAPRPLWGSYTPTGKFISGLFYGLVDLDEMNAARLVSDNIKLDAELLIPVETAKVARFFSEWVRDNYKDLNPEEWTAAAILADVDSLFLAIDNFKTEAPSHFDFAGPRSLNDFIADPLA